MQKKINFLGKLIIFIPSLIKGEIKLDVIFSFVNGIFKIVVKDIFKREKSKLDIYLYSIYINNKNLNKLLIEEKKWKKTKNI